MKLPLVPARSADALWGRSPARRSLHHFVKLPLIVSSALHATIIMGDAEREEAQADLLSLSDDLIVRCLDPLSLEDRWAVSGRVRATCGATRAKERGTCGGSTVRAPAWPQCLPCPDCPHPLDRSRHGYWLNAAIAGSSTSRRCASASGRCAWSLSCCTASTSPVQSSPTCIAYAPWPPSWQPTGGTSGG